MSDYRQVTEELAKGTPAELLCATCPWDRLCVTPPSMSRTEIDQRIEQAKAEDEARDPQREGMPVGSLMTALMFGGRDQMGELCPVFALRLRSVDGRAVADGIKQTMKQWGDRP